MSESAMADLMGLDIEVADSEVRWADLVHSLAADGENSLAGFGVLGPDGAPAMVECWDCMGKCDFSCGCGCCSTC